MADRGRRILILWFPHLGAERALRDGAAAPGAPFALVGEERGVQTIASADAEARAAGIRAGQGLRDALASCAALVTRPRDPRRGGGRDGRSGPLGRPVHALGVPPGRRIGRRRDPAPWRST